MRSKPVVAWAFYDFGNTIFSLAVLTLYFNEWVIDDLGRPDWHVGLMGFLVGLVLVVAMPAAGALSDRAGRRLPMLAAFTGLCLLATIALGTVVDGASSALVVGGLAIFGYQLALAMYDPLLATVAPEAHRGRVSGFGVGLGYVGVLVGFVVLGAIVGDGDKQGAFVPTALMFAAAALPIFLFVRERDTRTRSDHDDGAAKVVGDALRQVMTTVRHVRSDHREVGRFLIARFLYVDAIATIIAFMTVYLERLGGFSAGEKRAVLALSMASAAAGSFVAGRLVEAYGPKAVLRAILWVAAAALAAAAVTGSGALMWVVGPAIGVTLGAVWTSDRVLMLRLSPPAVRGEFFGIYNLVGKVSSGVGPLVLWGGTISLLHGSVGWNQLDASRAALAVLALAVLAGLWVLRPVTDHIRYADDAWETAA